MAKIFGILGISLSVVFGGAAGAMTATNYSFPSAKDFLQENGFDPAIAEQLAPDMNVRVRTKGNWANSVSSAELFLRNVNPAMAWDPYEAYAEQLYAASAGLKLCPVSLTDESAMSFANFIPFYTSSLPVEKEPLTPHELWMTIALHEIRHCHHINQAFNITASGNIGKKIDSRLWESDADFHALTYAAQKFQNPEIINAFIYFRSLSFGGHDTTLYLSLKTRGIEPPSANMIEHTNNEAAFLLATYSSNHDLPLVRAGQRLLEEQGRLLAPLTKERITLFVEAHKYFAPQAFEDLLPQTFNGPKV